jgi:putative hydroxymethylpyrimidine transport system substrate-binding protein
MRFYCCVAVLSLVAFSIPDCGGGKGPETAESHQSSKPKVQTVSLSLSGWRGPETAGLLMAEKRGYFADEGLKIGILSPQTPARPIKYVVEGVDDLAVSHLPQVVLAKEKGSPIIAVGSLIPDPTAALIWLGRSNIHGIADLKGKTIGIPGLAFQEGLLESILARGGLTLDDVTVRHRGYRLVPELMDGYLDAIFGGTWNVEGIELEERGLNPVIKRVENLGIPPYEELVFISRIGYAAKDPATVHGFMSALRRGTAAAMEDPAEAAKLIAHSFENNPDASLKEMEVEVRATLPLLSRTGHMSRPRANGIVDWMQGEGLIQGKPPALELLTNRYLTGG